MKIPFPVRVIPSLAFQAWLTPPPLPASFADRDRSATARMTRVHFGGVAGYETGSGPVAVAAHGWGGRAAQMAPIATRLGAEGYRVIVPELPGRAGGPRTDVKQVAAALRALTDDVGQPELVVGHSFASMALRLAFSDDAPRRVVLIAPALDVTDALEVFGERLRLQPWARRGLRARLEAWDPSLWPTMSGVFPAQLPGAQILIAHDPADGDTPFVRSAELAAIRPETTIIAVEGAGHSRILSDSSTLDVIARFVTDVSVGDETAA